MIDFHTDHMDSFEIQEAQRDNLALLSKELMNDLKGYKFTYLEDSKAKAFVGMELAWKGRAVVWAMVGDVDNWIRFHRETYRLMETYRKENGIIRLELITKDGFEESDRWAKMLGFELESVMRSYINGDDHKMWVKLWIH